MTPTTMTVLKCFTVDILHIPSMTGQRNRVTAEMRIAAIVCNAMKEFCPCDEDGKPLYKIRMGNQNFKKLRHFSRITTVLVLYGETIVYKRPSPLRQSYSANNYESPPSSPSTPMSIPRVYSDPILEELLQEMYRQTHEENNLVCDE